MVAEPGEFGHVDADTDGLHPRQHRNERHFHRLVQLGKALRIHRGPQRLDQPIDCQRVSCCPQGNRWPFGFAE